MAVAVQSVIDGLRSIGSQNFGTQAHKLFADYVIEYLIPDLGKLLGPDIRLHLDESIPRSRPDKFDGLGNDWIERDDDGRILWTERGTGGSARPDVIVTRWEDGEEFIVGVFDLKTGRAGISRSWMNDLAAGMGIPADWIEEVRPWVPRRDL